MYSCILFLVANFVNPSFSQEFRTVSGVVVNENYSKRLLNIHNGLRELTSLGILDHDAVPTFMNELTWDWGLTGNAQYIADQCGTIKSDITECLFDEYFKDDASFLIDKNQFKIGVNELQIPKSELNAKNIKDNLDIVIVKYWFAQRSNYNIYNDSCSSIDGCNNYKQLIWSKTRYLGCGIKMCDQNDARGEYLNLICHYYPKGNIENTFSFGSRPYEIGESCSNCPLDLEACDGSTNGLCAGPGSPFYDYCQDYSSNCADLQCPSDCTPLNDNRIECNQCRSTCHACTQKMISGTQKTTTSKATTTAAANTNSNLRRLQQPEIDSSVCFPTHNPTSFPSARTTTAKPSSFPSISPSQSPSQKPTFKLSFLPSVSPSKSPSFNPSKSPSLLPSKSPSLLPSKSPISSSSPTQSPVTRSPVSNPSRFPSWSPSKSPVASPSKFPSRSPSSFPTRTPSNFPTRLPSSSPSQSPSISTSAALKLIVKDDKFANDECVIAEGVDVIIAVDHSYDLSDAQCELYNDFVSNLVSAIYNEANNSTRIGYISYTTQPRISTGLSDFWDANSQSKLHRMIKSSPCFNTRSLYYASMKSALQTFARQSSPLRKRKLIMVNNQREFMDAFFTCSSFKKSVLQNEIEVYNVNVENELKKTQFYDECNYRDCFTSQKEHNICGSSISLEQFNKINGELLPLVCNTNTPAEFIAFEQIVVNNQAIEQPTPNPTRTVTFSPSVAPVVTPTLSCVDRLSLLQSKSDEFTEYIDVLHKEIDALILDPTACGCLNTEQTPIRYDCATKTRTECINTQKTKGCNWRCFI